MIALAAANSTGVAMGHLHLNVSDGLSIAFLTDPWGTYIELTA